MRGYPKLIATLAGVFLFAIMLPVTGRLAGLPWPGWVVEFKRQYPHGGSLAIDMLFYAAPVAVASFSLSWLFFRWLRTAGSSVVLALIGGWFIPVAVLQAATLLTLSDDPIRTWWSMVSQAGYWIAMAAIPAGVVAAGLLARRRVGNRAAPLTS
jgi:hypothetical protein